MNPSNEEIIASLQTFSKLCMYGKQGEAGKHYLGQYRCLFYLDTHAPVSQKELAYALSIKPATASELLSKLENKELIQRIPSKKDRRVIMVSLTESGKKEVQSYRSQRKQFYNELLEPLTEEEKLVFYKLLQKLNHN